MVAQRPAGCSPLEALRRHFLDGLARRDPVTGLNDEADVLAFHQLLYATPSLVARLYAHGERDEAALAAVLGGEAGGSGGGGGVQARLAAGQIIAVQRILGQENWRQISTGRSADDLCPEAVAVAESAFAQLGVGLPDLA
ncbi:hypothetical protein GCM10020295_78390 [Streptomyces cinereospinus]